MGVLGFPLVYDHGYDLNLGHHVFASAKYRLIREFLIHKGLAGTDDFVAPPAATSGQLLAVHTAAWIDHLSSGRLTYHEILQLEVPFSRAMVNAAWLNAGGSILAARLALEHGAAFNLGGGFHHAFADHGEGFCPVNDVAVAVRAMQCEHRVQRVLIVDCDVHQGNGTAAIFAADPGVFTFSAHQRDNYPHVKPPSDLDLEFDDGAGDRDYLDQLAAACDEALARSAPQLLVYVSGADPFFDDQLGGLALTKQGLYERDRLVFDRALAHHVPVMVTLAGGYARYIEDTVEIHANTAVALRDSRLAHR
jgi:acetoin utilization deacetylase AcuC-like enzyme